MGVHELQGIQIIKGCFCLKWPQNKRVLRIKYILFYLDSFVNPEKG